MVAFLLSTFKTDHIVYYVATYDVCTFDIDTHPERHNAMLLSVSDWLELFVCPSVSLSLPMMTGDRINNAFWISMRRRSRYAYIWWDEICWWRERFRCTTDRGRECFVWPQHVKSELKFLRNRFIQYLVHQLHSSHTSSTVNWPTIYITKTVTNMNNIHSKYAFQLMCGWI